MRYRSVCSGIEAASVASEPLNWTPVDFSEIDPAPSAVLAHRFPGCLTVVTSRRSKRMPSTPMFSSEDHLAREIPSPGTRADWMTSVLCSRSSFCDWLAEHGPLGSFSRTSLESCRSAEDGSLVPSLGRWLNSGTGGPTESWTLNTCEWTGLDGLSLSDDGVCSLSDILETGDVPQRFFLTAKACRGILRRAARRGRTLPEPLRLALEAVASRGPEGLAAVIS